MRRKVRDPLRGHRPVKRKAWQRHPAKILVTPCARLARAHASSLCHGKPKKAGELRQMSASECSRTFQNSRPGMSAAWPREGPGPRSMSRPRAGSFPATPPKSFPVLSSGMCVSIRSLTSGAAPLLSWLSVAQTGCVSLASRAHGVTRILADAAAKPSSLRAMPAQRIRCATFLRIIH